MNYPATSGRGINQEEDQKRLSTTISNIQTTYVSFYWDIVRAIEIYALDHHIRLENVFA